jgi:hypothetical protein
MIPIDENQIKPVCDLPEGRGEAAFGRSIEISSPDPLSRELSRMGVKAHSGTARCC